MRCHICDKDSDTIRLDKATMEFSACSECETEIFECVAGYEAVDELDEILDVGC